MSKDDVGLNIDVKPNTDTLVKGCSSQVCKAWYPASSLKVNDPHFVSETYCGSITRNTYLKDTAVLYFQQAKHETTFKQYALKTE